MNLTGSENQKIYTTAFAGKRIEDLPALLTNLEAVLIDVRFKPPALPLAWSENYLRVLLRRRYLHVPALGARVLREGRTGIQNLQLGMNLVKSLEVNALLICDCPEYENCHRRVIAGEFSRQNYFVQEIDNWK